MAVDSNPSHRPKRVEPARTMAPKGVRNASRPESGGQKRPVGKPMETPSMRPRRRPSGATWSPPSGSSPGRPPAD